MTSVLIVLLAASAGAQEMNGALGPYPMTRSASGTSWQPDSTPHEGLHIMKDDWMLMAHGWADLTFDQQGGHRGGEKIFSSSMLMGMAQRELGPGTFSARTMFSFDPAMGPNGYPLLLQTGETANGTQPLVDRQHPHDFIMELSISYAYAIDEESSVFGYFGLPGEPALGPPVFMHRWSGEEIPSAPITHHWMDSTHVSEGAATLGYVWKNWKAEASGFRGREPDKFRWDVEKPNLDSPAFRLSWNPTRDWALQASYGHIHSPEQLEPEVDQDRVTASAMWSGRWRDLPWQTTFAWGRNMNIPGNVLDAFLLEAAVEYRKNHSLLARAERVDKDELFQAGEFPPGTAFTVNALSLGYLYDFWKFEHAKLGAGLMGTADLLPASLTSAYGHTPLSLMAWLRVKLI